MKDKYCGDSSEDVMADNSIKMNLIEEFNQGVNKTFELGKIEGKKELLKELSTYIVELGRTQFNNRMCLSFVDLEKVKLNKQMKEVNLEWNPEN
jgi:hypothetical protein